MDTLMLAARATKLPCEASTSGTWVRFEGAGFGVYVIREAWTGSCRVVRISGNDNEELGRFANPEEAVAAVAQLMGRGTIVFREVELPPPVAG
ncbi:MAG: hypothetical protein ACYC1C_16515 [Chloroflexota bacterium]